MKRSTGILAGLLVFVGLLALFSAGLGLHSKSMMGMMKPGRGMMTMFGMMWTMRLWGVFVLMILFAGIIALFVACYRLTNHGSARCPVCHATVQRKWQYCPECGADLTHNSRK
jgi:RNA polymerase subunit RPABC4/transcription elongation factor Spt4